MSRSRRALDTATERRFLTCVPRPAVPVHPLSPAGSGADALGQSRGAGLAAVGPGPVVAGEVAPVAPPVGRRAGGGAGLPRSRPAPGGRGARDPARAGRGRGATRDVLGAPARGSSGPAPARDPRARLLAVLARWFGWVFVLALMEQAERRSLAARTPTRRRRCLADERIHGEVVRGVAARWAGANVRPRCAPRSSGSTTGWWSNIRRWSWG